MINNLKNGKMIQETGTPALLCFKPEEQPTGCRTTSFINLGIDYPYLKLSQKRLSKLARVLADRGHIVTLFSSPRRAGGEKKDPAKQGTVSVPQRTLLNQQKKSDAPLS